MEQKIFYSLKQELQRGIKQKGIEAEEHASKQKWEW